MVTFKWSRKIHQIYDIINTWKVRKMQYDKSFKEEALKLSDEIGVKAAARSIRYPILHAVRVA